LENERWFYNLELVFNNCSFTEQNLFIWEQEELNQNTDLNGEAKPKKDISEGIVLLVEDKECYTTLYGKENEVLFPKAIKFITKTELSQTIELKTLNFYQHLSINDCIADVLEMNKESGLSLAENVGIKNLLKLIFIKGQMGFPLGVKSVAKKMPQLINLKDAWQKSNIHSTVKPIKLMQYLVRLITPPNGIVLDPFNGSGTTGIAAKLEGFNYVGLELDPEYCKISEARISAWEIDKTEIDNQLSLF
jgi:DNA modification methylase